MALIVDGVELDRGYVVFIQDESGLCFLAHDSRHGVWVYPTMATAGASTAVKQQGGFLRDLLLPKGVTMPSGFMKRDLFLEYAARYGHLCQIDPLLLFRYREGEEKYVRRVKGLLAPESVPIQPSGKRNIRIRKDAKHT